MVLNGKFNASAVNKLSAYCTKQSACVFIALQSSTLLVELGAVTKENDIVSYIFILLYYSKSSSKSYLACGYKEAKASELGAVSLTLLRFPYFEKLYCWIVTPFTTDPVLHPWEIHSAMPPLWFIYFIHAGGIRCGGGYCRHGE